MLGVTFEHRKVSLSSGFSGPFFPFCLFFGIYQQAVTETEPQSILCPFLGNNAEFKRRLYCTRLPHQTLHFIKVSSACRLFFLLTFTSNEVLILLLCYPSCMKQHSSFAFEFIPSVGWCRRHISCACFVLHASSVNTAPPKTQWPST